LLLLNAVEHTCKVRGAAITASSTHLLLHRNGGAAYCAQDIIILITPIYYMLPAIRFRSGTSVTWFRFARAAMGNSGCLLPRFLWLTGAARGHGVPQPVLPRQSRALLWLCPAPATAGCFEERILSPWLAATASGVRDKHATDKANTAVQ